MMDQIFMSSEEHARLIDAYARLDEAKNRIKQQEMLSDHIHGKLKELEELYRKQQEELAKTGRTCAIAIFVGFLGGFAACALFS